MKIQGNKISSLKIEYLRDKLVNGDMPEGKCEWCKRV